MKRQKYLGPLRGVIASVSAAALVTMVQAQNRKDGNQNIVVKVKIGDYEDQRKITDTDRDGWCDFWCALHLQIEHRNKRADTDGDGVTDYEEMVLMRDPFTEGPMPRKLTAADIADEKKRAKEVNKGKAIKQAELRKMLEPFFVTPNLDKDGNLSSPEIHKKEKRIRLAEGIQDQKAKEVASYKKAKALAEILKKPLSFELPTGGVAVLTGEEGGRLQYLHSRSSLTSAESISVDKLWPGGSSGFDLTGEGDSKVRLGVWEPQGLVVDHPEFTGTVESIDSADSASGWSSTGGGFYAFNGTAAQCQEGNGCLDLRRVGGSPSTLYFKQHSNSFNFTDKTIAVWYYFGNVAALTENTAVQLRFGTSSTAYWERTFKREHLQSGLAGGWNLLSMKIDTATSVVGSPDPENCSYTALNVTFVNPAFPLSGDGQAMDHWRLSDTRIQNMDRASSVEDHSTHTTGLMMSTGVNANAKGMAFNASVHTRDSLSHLSEMREIFGNNEDTNPLPPDDDIFSSNHSYGPNPGWAFNFFPAKNYRQLNANGVQTGTIAVPAGTYVAWGGNLLASGTEDREFGRYTNALSGEIDDIVYGSDSLLPIWAAGNDRGDVGVNALHFEFSPFFGEDVVTAQSRPGDGGSSGFDTMPPDSVAKNILTVGSVVDVPGGYISGANPTMSSFSSFGPTDDGRIKPDVCANGDGVLSAAYDDPANPNDSAYIDFSGTSEASPTVAGATGLLTELVRRYRGDSYEPPASLLKGLLIHTADDILNAGPDYKSGWGLVNAKVAANLINQNEATHQGQNIRMVVVPNGGMVDIPAVATGSEPVKVTVVSTDPKGTESGGGLDDPTPMLVNDFSLTVVSGGSTNYPFSLNANNPNALATSNGPNGVDNVEQVIVSNPVAGQALSIRLAPAAGEVFVDDTGQQAPQEVALLISGIEPDPSLELVISSVIQTGPDKFTLVWPSLIGSTYRVQQSPDLTPNSFVDLPGDLVSTAQFMAREVTSDPDAISNNFWRVRKIE